MSGGLVDIHVLEETVSRVSDLTECITKQVDIVEQVSYNANKALGPASQQSKAIGQYRNNLVALSGIFEQIEQATKDLNELEAVIAAGPAKSGWQNYLNIVQHAQELANELTLAPQFKRFPQLPESAKSQFRMGISNLLNYVGRLGKAVFTPIDGAKYLINSGDPLPQFKPDELIAFSKLISALDQWPDITEGTDEALATAIEEFYGQSCSSVLPKMGARNGQFSVQSVGELLEQYKEIVNNGIQVLFNRNPLRMKKFMEINIHICQRMTSSAKSNYNASLSSSKAPSADAKSGPKISPSPSTPTAGGSSALPDHGAQASKPPAPNGAPPKGPPGPPDSTKIPGQAPGGPNAGGIPPAMAHSAPNVPPAAGQPPRPGSPQKRPQLSLNTQRDPREALEQQGNMARDSPGAGSFKFTNSPMTPDMAKTPQSAGFSTPMASNIPSISVNSPNSTVSHPLSAHSPTAASLGSSHGSISQPSASPHSAVQQQWAPLDAIERSRHEEMPINDLVRAKQASVQTLVNIFSSIEQSTRRSPITSEFGVSGACIQFMQTLRDLSHYQHGVDVVLSEMPTRGYLSKPPPMWAQRSEPTAAGRANPVSQYNADILDCLYANLHHVSTEQLRDVTKVGIFMLSNLSAVEHYVTESKDQTLHSMNGRKSPLMEAMGDVALQRFSRLIDISFKEYLTDWSKLAPVLMESTMTTGGSHGGKLSSKDRDVIKEKFRVFNSEFEKLTERQRRYQIADPVLRARMSQEVKKLVGPLYMRFYQKHSSGDFTKNLGKYVKYDINAFNRALEF